LHNELRKRFTKTKKRKKAMGGGMMDMTRMRYLKGGQV